MFEEVVYLILVIIIGIFLVKFTGRLTKTKIIGESFGGEVILIIAYMVYGYFFCDALSQVIP